MWIEMKILMFSKNSYFSKNFQCTSDQTKSSEKNHFLWTCNNQNHIFLEFIRIKKPIWVVTNIANVWNSWSNPCSIVTEKEWPTHGTYYANHVKNKHNPIESWLRKKMSLFERMFYEFDKMIITCSVLYMVNAKKIAFTGRSEKITPLLISETILNILKRNQLLYIINLRRFFFLYSLEHLIVYEYGLWKCFHHNSISILVENITVHLIWFCIFFQWIN